MPLSAAACQKIDKAVAKYPAGRKQSAVMAALTIAQEERGWLSSETLREVAEYLEMPPVAVYEVASFYSMYHLKPVGRYVLTLCTNLPCALQGADTAARYLRETLKIAWGETTQDGMFTVLQGECMGACQEAPVLLANHQRMCCKMTPPQIDALLAQLRTEAAQKELQKEHKE
ncbi:MAG: NADH-quinone oxidoreductase subunit NuoE [Burkholderiales bacterium]|jgi:NADH-quinone oxidoreductase subunit E|nr:NADH-quinone oxidoreductase subunit NuoE [Burkholderiales bacterium]